MEFVVKNESVKTFLKSALEFSDRDFEDIRSSRMHGYFKNSLHVKKSALDNLVTVVKVFMEDRSESGSILTNIYTYSVTDYDGISKLLRLDDFTVQLEGHATLNVNK